jgi:hypothetical protein
MTQSRFLEAPLVRQADGELKNVRLFGVMTKTSALSSVFLQKRTFDGL